MNGIINVIKPPGMSAHQVVSYLRKLLKVKRAGHTGTLDPGAGGVLPICLGKATKLVPFIIDYDKSYIAELTLGISTSTQDAIGETIEINTNFSISPDKLGTVFSQFLGNISQIPPMSSAIRVNGVRLYQLDRQGISVERKARDVIIHELHINKIWPQAPSLTFGSRVLFYVSCSKGTYIRTLCHDIGQMLGTEAHMTFLTRTAVGHFTQETAFTLEEIAEMYHENNFDFVIPMEAALPEFPQIQVQTLMAEKRILHGNAIAAEEFDHGSEILSVEKQVLMMGVEGDLLGIGEIKYKDGLICQPIRVLKEGS